MRDPLAAALDSIREPNLPPTEWDFRSLIHKNPSDVQRHELRAAVYYEYARESHSIQKLAEEYAELPTRSKKDFALGRWLAEPPISNGLFFLASLPFWTCILWPEFFPGTPWLAIPKPARAGRIKRYLHSSRKILFEAKRSTKEVQYWEISDADTRRLKSSGIEHRVIMFDWASGSNNEIVDAFARWVRHSRPSQFPSPRSDASRENVSAAFL